MPSLTADDYAERATYLGGTDLAAIAGMSAYAQPIDVWLEKTGQAGTRPTTPKQALGHLLEDTICDLFAEATGYRVRRPAVRLKPSGLRTSGLRDPQRPWLGGNIDRYARWTAHTYELQPSLDTLGDGVLDAKWSEYPDEWGEQGTTVVPPGYAVQLQHYLGITGRAVGFLAVLLPHADFRWYALPRDDEAIATLRQLGQRFWQDNVVPRVAPEPDGSEAYGQWLRDRYRHDGTETVATPEQQLWVDEIQRLDVDVAALGTERDRLAQLVQDSMGATTRLVLPGGRRLNWSGYERRTVHYDALARELIRTAYFGGDPHTPRTEELIDNEMVARAARHTTTTYVRPFNVPKLKEPTDA